MDIIGIKNYLKSKKYLKYIILAVIILIIVLYFKAFFTNGIYFDDVFLKKEPNSTGTSYTGKINSSHVKITVTGIRDKDKNSEVIFKFPDNINLKYTVEFIDANNWNSGIAVIIDKDGTKVFEGDYREGHLFMTDKAGNMVFDESFKGIVNGEVKYGAKVPLKKVADLAYSTNETIRGRFDLLFFAILLFGLTFIDIKYPLFFFTLNHFIDVKDPEPSEFYIGMQQASWVIMPIIGIILLIVAI